VAQFYPLVDKDRQKRRSEETRDNLEPCASTKLSVRMRLILAYVSVTVELRAASILRPYKRTCVHMNAFRENANTIWKQGWMGMRYLPRERLDFQRTSAANARMCECDDALTRVSRIWGRKSRMCGCATKTIISLARACSVSQNAPLFHP